MEFYYSLATDENGNITTFSYDGLDRVLTQTVKEPSGKILTNTTRYSKTGKISSTENNTLKTSFIYDSMGNLIQETDSDGNTKYYEYNEIGMRTGFRLNALGVQQLSLAYLYNPMGNITRVLSSGALLTDYDYDKGGNQILVSHANGSSTAYVYDTCNRIDTLVSKNRGTVLESLKHLYYPDGSMRAIEKQENGVYQLQKSYTYNLLGRLIEEYDSDGDKKKRTTYTYDHAGNRRQSSVYYDNLGSQMFESTAYAYNNLFQLLKKETVFSKGHPDESVKDSTDTRVYKYDLNGNQVEMVCDIFQRGKSIKPTSKPRVSFGRYNHEDGEDIEILEIREYNGLNQLIKVHKDGGNMSYSYKPSGMRYSKTLDGSKTTHVLDGLSIVLDISDNNRVKGIYLRGSSLCAKVQDNSTHYYLQNAHGDVVYLTDENANLLKYYDYSAFGIENKAEKNDSNPFRYCGEYYDKEIKNIYLRARYYDPAVGRFTSEDPIGDGQNWYAYCNNNPVMFVDPKGTAHFNIHGRWVYDSWEFYTPDYQRKPDPRNSFFTLTPTYKPEKWNTDEYEIYTNCYAYAFNMQYNPLTDKKFPQGGMQPGMLSGKYKPVTTETKWIEYSKTYLAGTDKSNNALLDLVLADMAAVGMEFLPYEEGMTEGYKVAFVVNPNVDYHWYRQDDDGTWSHKQGQTPITQDVGFYEAGRGEYLHNSNRVTDPKADAASIGYTSFIGYYYVRPIQNKK